MHRDVKGNVISINNSGDGANAFITTTNRTILHIYAFLLIDRINVLDYEYRLFNDFKSNRKTIIGILRGAFND